MKTQREKELMLQHGVDVDACDWCNLSYPVLAKERFYIINVIGDGGKLVFRKICGDCYDRLEEINK